jgi:hypothetical protein
MSEPTTDEKSGRIQLTPEQRQAFEDLLVLHDQMVVGGTDHKEPLSVIKRAIATISELGVRAWRQEKFKASAATGAGAADAYQVMFDTSAIERIAELYSALSDMTLMRDMLVHQLESMGIDPVVRVTKRQPL